MSNSTDDNFRYQYQKTSVFDDLVGLVQKPFVSGVLGIIDMFFISNINECFKLLFSINPFPSYQAELILTKEKYGDNWDCWNQKNERLTLFSIV